jgi:hypothetical protein
MEIYTKSREIEKNRSDASESDQHLFYWTNFNYAKVDEHQNDRQTNGSPQIQRVDYV